MLIDAHAHIQFKAFEKDADEVIQRAIGAGVFMIAPSSQRSTSERSVEYAKEYPGRIFAAVGLHPIHLKPAYFDPSSGEAPPFHTRVEEFDYDAYRKLAEQPEVVAIGECGLDYVERLNLSAKELENQERIFREQIELALQVGKPIIQHIRSGPVEGKERDAHTDALRILEEYVPQGLRGVAHCYSGNKEQAYHYFDLGFFISFTGLITFIPFWDELIKAAPLDRLLVETDSPYMTPVPRRGTRNEPVHVRYVAEKIAELKTLSLEQVAQQTTQNAQELFGLTLA